MGQRIKRVVRIPQELSNKLEGRLKKLVDLKEETNGVLLYVPIEGPDYIDCRVDELYMTAVGTLGHVIADPVRMAIINEFFQRHPEYRFIKWHAHSKGTGRYWHKRLSSGDMDSYREQLRHDPEFMGMMVSPSGRILVARGPAEMKVVPTWAGFEEKSRHLHEEILRAANSLGYDEIPRLRATGYRR